MLLFWLNQLDFFLLRLGFLSTGDIEIKGGMKVFFIMINTILEGYMLYDTALPPLCEFIAKEERFLEPQIIFSHYSFGQ